MLAGGKRSKALGPRGKAAGFPPGPSRRLRVVGFGGLVCARVCGVKAEDHTGCRISQSKCVRGLCVQGSCRLGSARVQGPGKATALSV